MKNFLLIFLFCICVPSAVSQEYKIPAIEFDGKYERPNYIEILKLKDTNSLIMSIGYSRYWHDGNSKFIVFQTDGKILKHYVSFKNLLEKPILKKKFIAKRKRKFYWKFLNDNFTANKFRIDKSKLNINEKTENGKTSMMIFSHGSYCNFNIYQNENYTSYSSYSPEAFIREKFPGYEEREKLVQLVTEFEELYDKN